MHFSWAGFWVAPLLVPLIGSAVSAPLMRGDGPVISTFLVLLIPACVISYGTMLFLFLPSLFLLSRLWPVTGWRACLLGLLLGAVAFVPITVLEWATSGPDSGPPAENFWLFLVRWTIDPFALFFPAAGLVTAGLYWWLGKRRRSRPSELK
jgi:hypothetical protein